MLHSWRRFKPASLRAATLRSRGAFASSGRNASRASDLLATAWEALNVARDNKALIIARDGTILGANARMAELCGHTVAELVGASIAPGLLGGPPGNPAQRWETMLQTGSGSLIPVEAVCEPLTASLPGVYVYAVQDLRWRSEAALERDRQTLELQRRDAELSQQNLNFEMALKSLSQGVCVFDAEQRLVVCNEVYLRTYCLPPEQVRPGTTLREILELRIARGFHAGGSPQAFIEERLAAAASAKASLTVHHLADGRIIDLAHHPIQGGGWVATHVDVTERRRIEAALAQTNRDLEAHNALLQRREDELEQQNRRFDTAMNNISQGLCFFDGSQRLIVCNQRYVQMYRLPETCARPGTTLREIVEHRFAAGSSPEMSAEQYLAWRDNVAVSSKPTDSAVQLKDGRVFAIHHEPMPDGGWVATHQDITEQCRAEAKIAHMAQHDVLTGLPNRLLFNERLEQALGRARKGEIVAVHVFDLDNFKTVNDTLGHPAGDKLLQVAAERLRSVVRGTDTVARMGGDEFAIVQVGLPSAADATSLANRIIDRISAPYEIEGQLMAIGVSIGIGIGGSDGETPDQLVRNADLALYRAKADGRGTYRFFEPEMDAQVRARRELEHDLRKALPAGEFELYYQPVVDIASNGIIGLEALIRWHHPSRGLVTPNEFIPLAEEIGLIIPMGEWIIREACSTAARWPEHLKIAVNLSPVQFRSAGLLGAIAGALAASGLSPARLELEITETILLQDNAATLDMLYQLRELGVCIAMDDFGTGYSSLSYLQSFPFDKIKIDRSFIKDIAESVGSLNIVRAVTALAKGLGMAATAEGVETIAQRDTVLSEGCTEMQGFLFSQPLPASEIERLFLTEDGTWPARGSKTAA